MNLISGQFVALFGAADRYIGSLESLTRVNDPDASFEAALAIDRHMRAPIHQIETLRAWGAHLRRSGASEARDRARMVDAEGHALAERIGYQRASDVAAEADGGPTSPPDQLTPRELDVLRLVARGLSNREIGAELFISQNTAANHVRSILNEDQGSQRPRPRCTPPNTACSRTHELSHRCEGTGVGNLAGQFVDDIRR